MKEIDIIQEQIVRINQHKGNINSNLNGNLAWKENLDEIVSNTSNISSEFDVFLHGVCNVINKLDSYVKSGSKNQEKLNQHEYVIKNKHNVNNSESNHPFNQNKNNTNCNNLILNFIQIKYVRCFIKYISSIN